MKWNNTILMTAFMFSANLAFSEGLKKETRKLIATSGSTHVQFIELYSSESCSSCPPADKWFSEFRNTTGLWKTFIPIVFHVDYWNNLGWRDRLSSKEMTKRQVDVSKKWPNPSVYTPAVVADGREWSNWRDSKNHNIPEYKNSNLGIELNIFQEKDDSFTVKVAGTNIKEKYIITIAQLGMGLISKVTSGENSGETFEHNFVVLSLNSKPLSSLKMEENFKISKSDKKVSRLALVAWIEKENSPLSLQATGGYL